MVDTAELVRRTLAEHEVDRPAILAMAREQATGVFADHAFMAGRGFYVRCACGLITDPGPRPKQDPGVTTDGSRTRALVLGRQHVAEEIARALWDTPDNVR